MFNLLAEYAHQHPQPREEEEEPEVKVNDDREDESEAGPEKDTEQPTEANHHLRAESRDPSFDLSASPLGLVSSLSSALLSSARRKVSSAVRSGGDAAKRLHQQASRLNNHDTPTHTHQEEEDEDAEEVAPHGTKRTQQHRDDDRVTDWTESKSSSHHRGGSWSLMKSAQDEADEKERFEEDDDSAPIDSSASASVSTADLTVLRMNFLRLLNRCEEASFQHLHAPSGTIPLLHATSGPASRTAKCFFKSVSLLQLEFLPEFRRRHALIHVSKENAEFMRRIAFLSTLSEKESQRVHTSLGQNERKTNYPSLRTRLPSHTTPSSTSLAYGVHSIRSASALLSAANSASIAASASTASASSSNPSLAEYDDSVEALLDRAMPSATIDRTQELRAQLFAKQQHQRDNGSGTGAASSSSSREFSAELEQRQLVSELHDMSGVLKTNALRMRSALATDAKVLEQVDGQLDDNLHAIKHENSRLKRWASAGCGEMCWNILLIVTLWTVFIAMFIFMKIFPKPTA